MSPAPAAPATLFNVLHEHLRGQEKVLRSRVNLKDDIYDSIKTFFGKGH